MFFPLELSTRLVGGRLISTLYRLGLGHINAGRELPIKLTVWAVVESGSPGRPDFDCRLRSAGRGSWLEKLAERRQMQSRVNNNQPNNQEGEWEQE
ncbi:hypothetical protein SBA2_630034 [Acidobacteriia bacterium SbA2]|nr:hypothetical protein SBA2_630034 [Acidobacteriia bacterium SbA2]